MYIALLILGEITMKNLSRFLVIQTAFIFLFIIQSTRSYSQESSRFINYQAVARDANGDELSGVSLEVEFSIIENLPQANPVYIEQHSDVITDPFGLFVLKIGNGIPIDGDYDSIDWSENTYLNIQINAGGGWIDLGTLQFISVPYALYASKADSAAYGADADADPVNEIQLLTKDGNIVSLSIGGGTFIDEVEDDDADSTNEFQTIDKLDNIVTLSDNGGTFIDEVDDADADSTNEYQSIAKLGNIVTLSDDGGSFTDEVDDADADATNEIQSITKDGNTVTLSDGGGTFIDEVDDADADASNEFQTLTKLGNEVTLSDNGGTFIDEVNDADADASNEIQVLSKAGSLVSLSNGGGSFTDVFTDADADASNELITAFTYNSSTHFVTVTEAGSNESVDLSDLKVDENWQTNGNNISNSNTGNVGINETNPSSTFHIMGSTAVKVRVEGPSGTNYLLGDETVFIGKPDIGDVEVDLPPASDVPGRVYIIKKGDPSAFNDLKIHANGSDKIEGVSTYILDNISGVYEQIIIVSDGVSDWWIISKD